MYAAPESEFCDGYGGSTMTTLSYNHGSRYEDQYEYDRAMYRSSFYPPPPPLQSQQSHHQLAYDDSYVPEGDSRALRVYRGAAIPNYWTPYDPLTDMRPGPLATGYLPAKASRSDNISSASAFFERELSTLSGKIHVLFESVRKFGRFDMK